MIDEFDQYVLRESSGGSYYEIKALMLGLTDEMDEIMRGSLVEEELDDFNERGLSFDLSDIMGRAYKERDYDLRKRYILRNLILQKVDELENLPFETKIISFSEYLEPS